jgi:hypothetical protein
MNIKLNFFCIFFVLIATAFPATCFVEKNNQETSSCISVLLNNPPEKPYIEGRSDGVPNYWYEFRFSSTDPDSDTVTILVDWGDGQTNSTYGASGQIHFLYHGWYTSDDYIIKAKAVDEHRAESEWATSPIHIPTSRVNAITFGDLSEKVNKKII